MIIQLLISTNDNDTNAINAERHYYYVYVKFCLCSYLTLFCTFFPLFVNNGYTRRNFIYGNKDVKFGFFNYVKHSLEKNYLKTITEKCAHKIYISMTIVFYNK